MKRLTLLMLAAALLVVPARPTFAQTDFSGAWALDRDISTDLTKATLEPQQAQTRNSGSGFTGGFGGRGGYGGRGSSGGHRSGGSNDGHNGGGAALTADERTRLKEIADYLKTFSSITIEHTDHSTFTVTDAQGHSHLFPTDGTKTPLALSTGSVDSVTKWDGPHMVTVFTIGPSRDLVFTYILVPASKQMALRVALDESGRPRPDVPELRLVYKRKS